MLRFIKHIFSTNLQSIPPLLKHIFCNFLYVLTTMEAEGKDLDPVKLA